MQDSFEIDKSVEEFIATLELNVPVYVNLCKLYKHAHDNKWDKSTLTQAQKLLQKAHDKMAYDEKIKRLER